MEEEDLLALALNGRSRQHAVPILCQKPPPLLTANLVSAHQPPPAIKDASYLENK